VSSEGSDYQGFHLTSGRFTAIILMGIAVAGAMDIVRTGDAVSDSGALMVLLAVCLVCYVLGLRPAVHEEVSGVAVLNPLRTSRCFAVPRRRPSPIRTRAAPRNYGFPSATPPARDVAKAKADRDPSLSRADGIASRLREQAEKHGPAAGSGPVTVAFAPAALGSLSAAVLLLVLAFVL
jgi:hypothetical protein